ncbi:MAG: hypothetical protein LBD06_01855 [Candidatus Accumulibacter sp.]|nr:hypothetical protein [Accumulibacter sp.]
MVETASVLQPARQRTEVRRQRTEVRRQRTEKPSARVSHLTRREAPGSEDRVTEDRGQRNRALGFPTSPGAKRPSEPVFCLLFSVL